MESDVIVRIDELLSKLPEEHLEEVEDFATYLLNKVRRKKAFEERVLRAEEEPTIGFNSVDEAMKAILDEAAKD